VAATITACGSPPGSPVDGASDNFAWSIDVSGLGEAVLSTCAGADSVYAVGGRDDAAFILEWTGSEWLAPVLPSSAGVLWWCWVATNGDAWAVGERGTVLTRLAGTWTAADPGALVDDDTTLYGVWGSSADLVHIVGGRQEGTNTEAVILAYDAGIWTAVDPATLPEQVLFKVWGASSFDVWAVGEGGVILRWAANQWSPEESTTDDRLIAVWGSADDDVYAVGGGGTGVVLRYDGVAWSPFATTPEPLSGVWTAPNEPLYVAGNRGYLARYDRLGAAIPDNPSVALPVDDLCFHAIIGIDDAVVATASDLFGGGSSSWRGAILSHRGDYEGPVTRAVPPDAGPPSDAAPVDAIPSDAGPPDAAWPGPGDECGMVPAICAEGLECWQLAFESFVFLCTQPCSEASECTADYGAGACCERPGIQTLETVCIPGSYAECSN
jgi:hypothetical protein